MARVSLERKPCLNLNPANWVHRIDNGQLKAYCTACEVTHYKGHVHEVVKKKAKQIIETTNKQSGTGD